jgi:predicted enzyme related to lactoylglutathione lyase
VKKIVQIEIPVSDLKRSEQFYAEVFKWHRAPTDMHNYHILDVPKDAGFGVALVGGHKENTIAHSMTLYLECKNIREIIKSAETSSGKVLFGPKKIPPYGEIFQIADPDGHRWGLFAEV